MLNFFLFLANAVRNPLLVAFIPLELLPIFQELAKQVDFYEKVITRIAEGNYTEGEIEGFLIAQYKNNRNKPMYGCTVTGKFWDFFIIEERTYCISKAYNCTEKDDLLLIIAILRKFKDILETRLLD
jgi:hypothetical protein